MAVARCSSAAKTLPARPARARRGYLCRLTVRIAVVDQNGFVTPDQLKHETRGRRGKSRIVAPGLVSRFPGGAFAPPAKAGG